MTNQQTNRNVAEVLGLKTSKYCPPPASSALWSGGKLYQEWHDGKQVFEPATRPADALWALERYCDKGGHVCTLLYFNESGWIANWTNVDKNMGGQGMGTFCEAICAAIEPRRKENR